MFFLFGIVKFCFYKRCFYSTTWLNTHLREVATFTIYLRIVPTGGAQFRICSILQRNTVVKFSSIPCPLPLHFTTYRHSVWQSVKTRKSISRPIVTRYYADNTITPASFRSILRAREYEYRGISKSRGSTNIYLRSDRGWNATSEYLPMFRDIYTMRNPFLSFFFFIVFHLFIADIIYTIRGG